MVSHEELINEIAKELYDDDNVSALILYGSVARREECANSDIDLLVIDNKKRLRKKHVMRGGVTVEFIEMNIERLRKFVAENEIQMYFALAEGVVLFDKDSGVRQLIDISKKIIADGPPGNKQWENEAYQIKRRSDLTEIYTDLLDVNDEIEFNYIASVLIAAILPMILEINRIWPQSRKRTINNLKTNYYDGYKYIEILLSAARSLSEKRAAAKDLINYALKRYGGVLTGDAIIFNIDLEN